MKATFVTKYTGSTPKIIRKEMRTITTENYQAAGEMWHEQFRPKHFTTEGAAEYGYKKRKGENLPRGTKKFARSYYGAKLRTKGHDRPLVYTGQSELLAKILDVRATSKGSRTIIHARGLRRKHPKSQINMAEEMTTISQREQLAIVQQFNRNMQTSFDRRKESTTTKT